MGFRRHFKSCSACLVPLIVFCLILSRPAVAQSHATSATDSLVLMVKDVVIGAAQWGIEEAGVRIFGNSGWKLCKVVFRPSMDALQRRYPQLFDTKSAGTAAAKSAAADAAAWVVQDRQFQATITEQLKVLDQASREQLAMIIDIKQANEKEHRLLHQKIDGYQQRVDRIEQRLVVVETRNTVPLERASRPVLETEDWYAKATKAKDPNEKIRQFTEAINHDQNTVNAYVGRGNAYFELQDFNSAYADFARTTTLSPSFAVGYTNRGAASQGLGRQDAAIADFRKSMELDAAIEENYGNLTQIYVSRKNYAEAYAVAKLRLQQPRLRDAAAYGAAGWYALFARDFQRAIAYSQKGLSMSPGEKWIGMNLAHGYLLTGQFAEADALYFKYSGIKLSNLYWEEMILNDFRELEEAGVHHDRMNALRVSLYGNLSYHLLFERRFQDASTYAQMGLQLDPDATWIKSNLAHSLLLTNQVRQASTIYDAYAGRSVLGKRWEQVILEDFDALRAGGISNASMAEISARMRASMERVALR